MQRVLNFVSDYGFEILDDFLQISLDSELPGLRDQWRGERVKREHINN